MALKARYTVVDGEVIAEKRSGVRHQLVPDPLGSTIALLDNTQTQTDTFTYWPYGEEQSRTGTTATPLRFVGTLGYYRDSSIRTYVRARYLSTQQGRWMTQDPIGFEGGDLNLHRYAGNQPTNLTDATGKYTTIGCTDQQKKQIRIAMDDLCVRLKYLSLLPGNFPGLACLKSRCGLASGGHGAVIRCAKPGYRLCASATVCAGTPQGPRQGIYLCPHAWDPRPFPIGCGCLGSTIVHELVHSCIGDPDDQQTFRCEGLLYGPNKPSCP